jgi:hypothetical protein
MNGCINGLVASCGTGGTIAGIGKKLHGTLALSFDYYFSKLKLFLHRL